MRNPVSTPTEPADIVRRVAGAASARPDAPAVADDSETLSHGELQGRSDALAARLCAAGVEAGELVAICLPRSCAQLVAMLGVWKAGAACLALDPAWPAERLRFLVEDAGCAALLLGSDDRDHAPVDAVRTVFTIGAINNPPTDAPVIMAAPSGELAYVIYTSGSTGVPKGVEVAHANFGNLVDWHNATFGVTADTRAASMSSLGFDANLWEIWPYLCAGASVTIVPDRIRISAKAVAPWLVEQSIDIAFAPTLLAEQLIAMEWPAEARLAVLLTGADTLTARPPATLPFTLVNNYGPTECTVVATSGPVSPEAAGAERASIGRPIANCQVYLLDQQRRPVAEGSVGEIHIGGAGVALGYRGRPDLTADRFITDPWSNDPAARLYRTGDLASRNAAGDLSFHGRIDDQVKIRGHRVEPEEVAAILRRHSLVSAAAVTAGHDAAGAVALTAYVIPSGTGLDAETVRAHLASFLPDYFIPASFVRLDRLPVTSNGKLDRAALPTPSPDNQLSQRAFEAPTNPLEERLATILADVMKRESVGLDDNFFLIGGHSLLGTQIVLRAADALGVDLSLRDLFDAPTVRRLAKVVEQRVIDAVSAMSDEQALRLLGA